MKIAVNISLVLLLFFSITNAIAQRDRVNNLPSFDNKRIHFGFTLGINTGDFIMENYWKKEDSLLVLETQKQSGFNLGIVSVLHFNPAFSLRFIPSLSFTQRNLEYLFQEQGSTQFEVKPIESTYIDLPLNLKYRSERLNNFAAYLLAGGKYSIDLASKQDVVNSLSDEIVVKIKRNSYSYEIGFGMDFFLQYFKFSPEIKLSVGLNNVIVKDDTKYSDPILKLYPKMFLVSFNFEG